MPASDGSASAPMVSNLEFTTTEVLAARLYTGPMFTKYNAVLRGHTGNKYLEDQFKQLCENNMYASTLHAINSAIIKLSADFSSSSSIFAPRIFTNSSLSDAFSAAVSCEVCYTL